MRLSSSIGYREVFRLSIPLLLGLLLFATSSLSSSKIGVIPVASAWEWTNYIVGGSKIADEHYMTDAEISELRVRDLKRRLARKFGYSQDELAKMLDKKDLKSALIGEESKLRTKHRNKKLRKLLWQSFIVAILCVVAIVGSQFWTQLYQTIAVNLTVYYDRKSLEMSQCWEFRSIKGALGIAILSVLELLRLWLSFTVLLSWVLSNESQYRRYLFPIPSFAIKPGQFMGEQVQNSPAGQWGLNIAPMLITWCMGSVKAKLEYWTGNALSAAARLQRQQVRSGETVEERKARRAAKKAAKRTAREENERNDQELRAKETMRRKEMADRATEQLFGNKQEQKESSPQQSDNEPRISDEDFDNAKKEFEAEMDEWEDMDDLD